MRPLVERRGRKLEWFRYPFLHSGTTEEVHQAIMDFLARRGYRVAPVTVDYADYTFAGVFRNQRMAGDEEVAERIKRAYLEQVDLGFEYAEQASVELFGHEIPQILLIHCNELNALTLRDTIARLRKRGYTFIPLGEAMADAAYARPDTFAGPGGSWLSRTATAMGRKLTGTRPPIPEWITRIGTDAASRPRTETPRPPAFREDWKETPAATPVTQEHVANPDLILTVHGPGRDGVKKSHHDQPADDPYYIWSGDTNGALGRVAAAPPRADRSLRSRPHPLARETVRLLRASPDRSGRSGTVAGRRSERWPCGGLARARVPVSDLTWRALDITRIVEGRAVEKPDLSKVLAVGVTDLRAGGGTPASSRLDWIEVTRDRRKVDAPTRRFTPTDAGNRDASFAMLHSGA